ncbi:MAG: hypothetical protein A2Y04_05065 [Omnitrophica WOR_2 bacterium GWC2_45_7]|nr:MAG: hypothetical protein A2Y04_05065 [Omnitrophica WOR_2 bacterium GWC2_45_7]
MTAFFVLLSISAIGLAIVGWILLNEKKSVNELAVEITPEEISGQNIHIHTELESLKKIPQIPPLKLNKPKIKFFGTANKEKEPPDRGLDVKQIFIPKKKSFSPIITKILGNLKFGKHKTDILNPTGSTALPSLKEFLANQKRSSKEEKNLEESSTPLINASPQDSAVLLTATPEESLKGTPLTEEEEKNIMQEIEFTTQLSELKEKHDTLDRILRDKNNELEQSRQTLEIELKNKKDYNKVKDILEKDLKEIKERARTLQGELAASQAENEGHKKRVHQLETKTSTLEKHITQKEEEITALNKQLQDLRKNSKSTTTSLPQSAPAEAGGRGDVSFSEDHPKLSLNENDHPEENLPSKEPQ